MTSMVTVAAPRDVGRLGGPARPGRVPARTGGRPTGASIAAREAPLRLTRRGRLVIALLVATVALLGARVAGAAASAPGEPVEVRVHVVAAGETLWGHASRIASPGEDLRDVVAEIVELNGLSSSSLQAGQRLLLPVQG